MISLAAIQPSFLPWRGFFDILHKVDIFVFYDDVQYERRSWRNRNRIKTAQGTQWLTVPVVSKGKFLANVDQIEIDNSRPWQRSHLEAFRHNYRKAPYFETYYPLVQEIYQRPWTKICDLNIYATKVLAKALGISVRWVKSSEFELKGQSTDRLVNLCQALGADHYLSGPAAMDYIQPEKFQAVGITLEYQIYEYPEYPQLFGPFEPYVSVVDLLFNCGPAAPEYIWGGN